LNEHEEKTIVQKSVGSDATWKNLNFTFDVTKEILTTQKLKVSVYDKNVINKDVLIASSDTVSLVPAGAHIGKETEINVNFGLNAKDKPLGRVSLFVTVHEIIPEEKVVVDPNYPGGYLHITDVYGYNLKNTEILGMQDPYVVLTTCGKSERTSVLEDIGANPVWEFQDMRFPMTKQQLETETLVVEAYDKNTTRTDAFIGRGEVKIAKAGVIPNSDVEFEINLIDDKNKPSGTLKVRLRAKENDPVVIPPSAKPIELPKTFMQGLVCISCIQGFGLKNTELIGKQDPYVTMKFEAIKENIEFRTPTCKDKGGEIIWNEKEYKFIVDRDDVLANKDIEVEVFDENSLTRNVLIGIGRLPLRRLASSLGEIVEVSVNIKEKDKQGSTGRLVFHAEMREGIPEVKSPLPADFTIGVLRVIRIRTFDLTNLELIGKQDPYVKVFAGSYWQDKTYVQEEAGSDVLWDFLDMCIPVNREFLSNEQLLIEAWESNVLSDLLIGSGRVPLDSVAEIGKEIEISVPLKDKKNKDAGKISIFLRLDYPVSNEVVLPKEFKIGTMYLRRICAFGLANKEIIGSSDPYVILSIRDWEGKTNALTNQGANVVWDFLDLRTRVTPEMLKTEKMSIQVKDKNSLRKDAIIGIGEVKILRAGLHIGDEVLTELSAELKDINQKSSGRITIYVEVKEGEEIDEKNLKIPNDFKFGTLNITRINSFDLKNTELIGLQDPFVEIKIGDWCEKTYTKEEGGGFVLWEYLDMRCDVTDDMVKNTKMEITVWDENKATSNSVIGTASATMLRPGATPGKEVEIPVSLIDNKGKFAGRLLIYATVTPADEGTGSIPESFSRGDLHIKRISTFSLRNTEIFGKQDPYVTLFLSDFPEYRTKTLTNVGANPSWKHLDFHYLINSTVLRSEEIRVSIYDKNDITKDTIIGNAVIPINRAGMFLEKDVELFGSVQDVKGKEAGRIVLQVNLHELPPESKDGVLVGLPETFTAGIVEITRISAIGLKNKELFGSQVNIIYAVLTLF
jgi:Ca2+-dependent lipid-binding protein